MNDYMIFVLGVVTGAILFLVRGYVLNLRKERFSALKPEFHRGSIFNKLKDIVRHIVVEYNIRNRNNDFLLNLQLSGKTILQLTHRSHYPEILADSADLSFGIALYLPLGKLTRVQKELLVKIIKEESDVFLYEEVPFEYYVSDFGKRIKYTGYFLNRILVEAFGVQNADEIEFELLSEGELSYNQE